MKGIVEKIRIYTEKGAAGIELADAHLIENLGLEGDLARGGERQVSVLFAETRAQMEELREKGLCLSRFKENITVGCKEKCKELKPGDRLSAGEAVLEISGESKRCHGECALFEAGKPCSLAGMSLFAKVIKSGRIRNGDRIYQQTCKKSLKCIY